MRAQLTVFLFVVALSISPTFAGASCGECDGDVDANGIVDFDDLLQVLTDWGCTDCEESDVNDDGIVDFDDLLMVLSNYNCEAGTGSNITGTVTNSLTGMPIPGVTVLVGECPFETDEQGDYTGSLPPGSYMVMFSAENYITVEEEAILFPDFTTDLDVVLMPVAPVVVKIVVTGDAEPGAEVEAMAIVTVLDGSTIEGFNWTQTEGAPAMIEGADTDTVAVDLGSAGEYKAQLFEALYDPPIDLDNLPPEIEIPPGEIPGGLQDRFQVVAVNPFALEHAGVVGLMAEVMTTSGTYDGHTEVHTHLPWQMANGIRNVGIGVPVLLNGKDQGGYDWTLLVPEDSDAEMIDPTTQTPEFTPDIPGLYTASVIDEGNGPISIHIFAGTWRGTIVGEDDDGRPQWESACSNCHVENGVAADKFTPWSQTGHAEIFTDNLNTSTHYGERCFPCHTVGYNPGVFDNGIDDQDDYMGFLSAGLINNPSPDNWSTVLADFPDTAMRANIQCENCHGPHNADPGVFSAAHTTVFPRVNISSEGCGTCHGEPLRHGRFTQWQLSGHANYELAEDESQSGTCSKCHTTNGFLAWLPILLGDEPGDINDPVEVTWTVDEAQPQTCVACHDPHAIGTESGDPNNATVRISGNTPELTAGFAAYGVGRGAICMTCHNSRRGLRNDDTFDEVYQTAEASRAPHGSSQTDLLMGENAYLVTIGNRANHSFLSDTCANCHMEATPPPPDISYNLGGTNHTFFAATSICADCHGQGFDAESIQSGVQDTLDILQSDIENAMFALFDEQFALNRKIDLNGDLVLTDSDDIEEFIFGEFRGRQSITIIFEDMSELGPYRVSDIDVLDNLDVVIGQLYDFAEPNLIKAGWNWNLVNNDGSLGVHAPTYAYDVLVSAIEGLGGARPLNLPAWLTEGVPTSSIK